MFAISVLLAIVSHFYLARSTYYVGVSGAKTWAQAQEACQSGVWVRATGGHLATWNSFDEYKNKVVPASNFVNGRAWIGLSDLTEGTWQYVDNNPSGNQLHNLAWSPGQPDNAGNNQDCGQLWEVSSRTDGNVKGIDDSYCTFKRNYICEFPDQDIFAGTEDIISGPMLDSFPADDGDKNNNYFTFEFSSNKDMMILAQFMLNVVLMAAVCGLVTKRMCGATSDRPYSKVNMYAIDEKLNI